MATIDTFKSKLANGAARPNFFRVDLTFPTTSGEGADFAVSSPSDIALNASFLIKATSLPSSTLENINVPYRGRPVNFSGERSFEPWNITVINDTDFSIRNAMEQWHNRIVRYDATQGAVAWESYQTTLKVTQLDRNDQALYAYEFVNAYPTSIGSIDLNYDQTAAVEEFDVTFTFDYFTSVASGLPLTNAADS